MDNLNNTNPTNPTNPDNATPPPPPIRPGTAQPKSLTADLADLKEFFQLTGGSFIYCLSAAFVAYGIVKIMGPILAGGDSLRKALPCILTLHVYELAILGALLVVVFKKVIDDAVSLAILIALLLVGTSITQGSVADTDIPLALILAGAAVLAAFFKFFLMVRFAKIPFRRLTLIGLGLLVLCNYFGPILLARAVAARATQEAFRRELWMVLWLVILVSAFLVIREALRGPKETTDRSSPFLQSPAMAYLFAFLLLIATGAHQYAMAFTFTLAQAFGDYLPVIAAASILLVELLRQAGKKFGLLDFVLLSLPLAAALLAINEKAVIVSGKLSTALIAYPPVFLALAGLAILVLAMVHGRRSLLYLLFPYLLGVILTMGFSPDHPHDLNGNACFATLVTGLMLYGIIRWKPNFCIAALAILTIGLAFWDKTAAMARYFQTTPAGFTAGIFGLGILGLSLLFGQKIPRMARALGILCFAGFVLDFLPNYWHWNYLFAAVMSLLVAAGFWLRTKDKDLPFLLLVPFIIRSYILSKPWDYWRVIIVGFLLLGLGILASLFKAKRKMKKTEEETSRNV